jgi:pyruvate ferredoxin oxidoreductase gamma subunit
MGVKKGGIVIVNTEKKPDYTVPEGVKLITIDATSIALKAIGLPITNTSLMGAFAAATGEIQFSALEKALNHRFPKELAVKNIEAARVAFDRVRGAA